MNGSKMSVCASVCDMGAFSLLVDRPQTMGARPTPRSIRRTPRLSSSVTYSARSRKARLVGIWPPSGICSRTCPSGSTTVTQPSPGGRRTGCPRRREPYHPGRRRPRAGKHRLAALERQSMRTIRRVARLGNQQRRAIGGHHDAVGIEQSAREHFGRLTVRPRAADPADGLELHAGVGEVQLAVGAEDEIVWTEQGPVVTLVTIGSMPPWRRRPRSTARSSPPQTAARRGAACSRWAASRACPTGATPYCRGATRTR